MSTFYTTVEAPRQSQMPEWMREERYMYCDQTVTPHHPIRNSKLWKKLMKVFG